MLSGAGRDDFEPEFADDVAIRAGELGSIDAADGGDLVDRPRRTGRLGGGVECCGRDRFDRPAGQETRFERATVGNARGLADRLGNAERARHAVDLAERLSEGALSGVVCAKALVPCPKTTHSLSLARAQPVTVGVLVLPVDSGKQALVVESIGDRRTDAGLPSSLAVVEPAPLGPAIDLPLGDDESAVATDRLAVSSVTYQPAATLRTGRPFALRVDPGSALRSSALCSRPDGVLSYIRLNVQLLSQPFGVGETVTTTIEPFAHAVARRLRWMPVARRRDSSAQRVSCSGVSAHTGRVLNT